MAELPGSHDNVVMRFAPNPSGPLHIGHARAAVPNGEYVKRYGGKLVLRIEDTDPKRVYEPAYEMIPEDLEWLGVKADEIIYQSDRFEIYYDIARQLIEKGAENIDLVTPTHYLPTILPALEEKLSVPVVYNCGGYERVETLRQLEGKIDIYLPDLKYADNRLAAGLSGASDYFQTATAAIQEMVRQTGPVQWDGEKVTKGVIVRHLILPGCVENSLKVLDWLGENFASGEILVSLMRQYTPMGGLKAPFDRRVTDEEYDAVLSWMFLNDLEGFTQDAEAADQNYIPDF